MFNEELIAAKVAARNAGKILMKYYKSEDNKVKMKGIDNPVTIADNEADEYLSDFLIGEFPNDGWLSEETVDTEERLSKDRVWIVDPLDGTKEFITKSGFFTINFALISNNKPVFGIICQPTTSSIWFNNNNTAYKIKKTYNILDAKELKPKTTNYNKLNMICSSTNLKSGIKNWLNMINPLKNCLHSPLQPIAIIPISIYAIIPTPNTAPIIVPNPPQ